MKTDKRVVFAQMDDWVGLYVDGELKYENHSIDPDEVLDFLGIPYESHYFEDEDGPYAEAGGFPNKLEDLVLES